MSDDEYYDEFDEDIFWIEEPEPDAADDLAATAHYDALYIDDPVLEAEDYFSDWEELSDDFYDEDPTAIRRLRAMGQWPNKTKDQQKQERAHHLKKSQPPQQSSALQPDLKSFQSVIWKSPADENNVVLYQPGKGEQVALLKNWREVFRNSHPALERSRAGRARGAMTNGAAPAVQTGKQRARRTRGSTVPAVDSVPDDGNDAKTVEKVSSPAVVRTARVVRPPSTIPVDQKTSQQQNSVEPNGSFDAMQTQSDAPNGTSAAGEIHEERTKPPTTPRSTRGRKRKASVSQEHPVSNENIDDGRRSKRVASKKVGDTTEQPVPTETTPVRRSARRKK